MSTKPAGAKKVFHRPVTKAAEPAWFTKLKQEPIAFVSKAALAFGALILLMFFADLREWPDLDLSGAASMLWFLAAIGFLMVGLVMAVPLLPSLHTKTAPEAWWRTLPHYMSHSLPATLFLLGVVTCFAFDRVPWPWSLLAPVLVLMLLGNVWWRYSVLKSAGAPTGESLPGLMDFAGDMLIGMLIWFVTLLLAMQVILAMYASGTVEGWRLFATALLYIGLIFAVTITMMRAEWRRDWPIGITILLFTVVGPAFVSQNVMVIPKAAIRAFGLGDRPAKLVVTEAGCEIANQAAGQEVCKVTPGMKTGVICPAILKSRIGGMNLIELSPVNDGGLWPEAARHPFIPLKKDDVLSWPRISLPRTSVEASESGGAKRAAPGSRAVDQGHTAAVRAPYVTFVNTDQLSESLRAWVVTECASGG